MTAEVAVMNRMGVALAADSAVTIGASARKIYTSAEKLFQLSEMAPVGVMIYGSAEYVSLPWETIIKAYRKQLGRDTKPTVAAYCDDLIGFLHKNHELFPAVNREHEMEKIVYGLLEEVRLRRKRVLDRMRREKPPGTPLTADEIRESLRVVIEVFTEEVTEHDPVEGLGDGEATAITSWMNGWFPVALDEVLKKVDRTDEMNNNLFTLASEYLRRQAMYDYKSGVVIAGFGEKEYMPSIYAFEVEEAAGDVPRLTRSAPLVTTADMPSRIVPYAQYDSVIQFLLGVDSDLSAFMTESVKGMTGELVNLILTKVGEANPELANDLRKPIDGVVDDHLEKLADAWNQERMNYFQPVLGTIASLPKDELAAMAEAFVNLTKFRRRVTPVPETVSGPIDVAVITKGDGYVWIRRKHYFTPDINPRIMARFHQPGGQS